jgi:Glycosyl transferases group 1
MSEMRISTRICPFFSTPTTELADTIPQELVIAGGDESLRTLDERIDQRTSSLGNRVEVTGRLRFDTLRALIAGADLLIMPSLHEGAGLPPLEATTPTFSTRAATVHSPCPYTRPASTMMPGQSWPKEAGLTSRTTNPAFFPLPPPTPFAPN